MKFIDEYRDARAAQRYARAISRMTTRPWTLMEVCGGQTHAIVKFGLDEMLPREITLVHGPGCPVCVTPVESIDKAIEIASRRDVIARDHPARQVVFFAVGFETTAPANAMAVYQAEQLDVRNFSLLVSHVLVPPAMEAILSSPQNRVQGFLAAGHVCTVMGYSEYEPIAQKYRVPIVVTGFEPLDILQGVSMCVQQLEEGRAEVENQYTRSVRREGNLPAQRLIREVFRVRPRRWRGVAEHTTDESAECMSGLILQGVKKPHECFAFGTRCTPEHPLGATMVSSEGACAAYYRYRRRRWTEGSVVSKER